MEIFERSFEAISVRDTDKSRCDGEDKLKSTDSAHYCRNELKKDFGFIYQI